MFPLTPGRGQLLAHVCAALMSGALLSACSTGVRATAPSTPNAETLNGSSTEVRFVLPQGSPSCGMEFAQDGGVGPVTCSDGSVNGAIVKEMVIRSPRLFALTRTADWASTEKALCSDYFDGGTIPITSDAYLYRYTADNWKTLNADFPTPEAFANGLVDGTYCK